MRKILRVISLPFFSNEKNKQYIEDVNVDLFTSPESILSNPDELYLKQDLVYFKNLNAYGAVKYEVVKDILANNKQITVSDIHVKLNSIYFSLDEKKHQNNKKAAYKHLEFLSKNSQNELNEFSLKLLEFLRLKFPVNQSFDLVEYLVNPFVFIGILKEYGFLDNMDQLNPFSEKYKHESAIKEINNYYQDSNLLHRLIFNYLNEGNPTPDLMNSFLDDIQSDHALNEESKIQFFASMIFSGTHSTASFLATYVYTVFNQFPHLLNKPFDSKPLESVESEVLRIFTPVQWIFRTVREQTNYAGIDLKVGDTVMLFVGLANLDPSVFPNPKTIQFERDFNHLSFGIGPYACIGRYTARRNAWLILDFLADYKEEITFVEKDVDAYVQDAITKIPLLIKYEVSNN